VYVFAGLQAQRHELAAYIAEPMLGKEIGTPHPAIDP